MSYIKADNPKEQEHFDFLEELRQSGDTNMYGASPYLQSAFDLGREEAIAILSKWMRLHSDPTRKADGPSSQTKVTAKMQTTIKVKSRPRTRQVGRSGR